MKTFFFVLFFLMMQTAQIYAYKVFMHVGHDFSAKELIKSSGWGNVAKRADGVWFFDAWTRTFPDESTQNTVIKNIKTREFAIAEFHWSPHFIAENKKNEVIGAPRRNGFSNIWCMVYNEKNYGSTLTTNEIILFRKIYPDYKLITNFRAFNPSRFAGELALLDGISYEFSAQNFSDFSQHHPNQTKIENVASAIKWCIDNDKKIFLLIPPGLNITNSNYNFGDNLIEILHTLNNRLTGKYIMSDNLIIVPATYDCRKNKIHNTPEKTNGKYANTGTGATLAALDLREKFSLRDLALLPLPREMNFADCEFDFKNLSDIKKKISIKIDPEKIPQAQGYKLQIAKNKISILAHDKAGAFYAKMTLQQIACQCADKKKLPCLFIFDYPDILNRGVMLDISRDKVPKMETLKKLVDTLAECKINQFQLYTEHTFAYKNHKTVWKNASPMTAEQIRELDAYCKKRFIDLVPNQNSLGHFERWLKHDEYKKYAEEPDKPSYCLNATNPEVINFISGLYSELLPNFSSKFFNVGCDEAFQIGNGGSSNEVAKLGKENVYYNYLMKIHKLVEENGKTMMFWADMLYGHPDYFTKLPTNCIALVWGYCAGELNENRIGKFGKAECRFYVCPSTCTFNTLFGRYDNMMQNVRDAVENGNIFGAEGLLMTIWGDNGNWQQLPFEYPGIAYAAALSWCYDKNKDIDIAKTLNQNLFKDESGVTGNIIVKLGKMSKPVHHFLPLQTLVFFNPNFPLDANYFSTNLFENSLKEINTLKNIFKKSNMKCKDANLIINEINISADLAEFADKLALARYKTKAESVEKIPAKYKKQLADELNNIIKKYKKIWLKRNRKGGLNDSIARLNNILAMLTK